MNQTCETFNPFKAANEAFQTMFDAGVKFQQSALNMIAETGTKGEGTDTMRRRFETLTTETVALAQKNAEEGQKLFDRTCRTGVEFFKKNFERVGKIDGNAEEFMQRGQVALRDSFDVMRTNTEAMADTNTRMIENWSNFANRTMAEPTEFATKKSPATK
jgi:hypothetical protein